MSRFGKKNNRTPDTVVYIILMYLLFFGKFLITKSGLSAPPLINYTLLIVSIGLFLPYFKKVGNWLLVYLCVYITYFVFKALVYGMPFVSSLIEYSSIIFIVFFAVPFVDKLNRGLIDSKQIRNHLYFILIFEIIISILQYISPSILNFFYIDSYTWNGTVVESGVFDLHQTVHLLIGTFFKPQSYANIISIFVIVVVLDQLNNNKSILGWKLFLVLASMATLLLTGVRTPFIMLVVVMLLVVYKYRKSWFFGTAIFSAALLIVFLRFSISDDSSTLFRMQSGFSAIFSGEKTDLENQTIGYSFLLVSYFLSDPLFGVSLGDAYQLGGRYTLSEFSHTDVQLVYTFCEIGIIGVVIFLWPLFKLKKSIPIPRLLKNVWPVLLLIFLLTIVDDTLFNWESKFLYTMSFAILYRNNKNQYGVRK